MHATKNKTDIVKKKTHFSVLLQSNKNEQERLQDEECQARTGATVAPQGQWCLLSAVHSSGTTPAKSRCNVAGLARQFWPLPHRRRLPHELSSAPPVLTRRRADVLQQAAATNLKSLSVFFFCLIVRPMQGRLARHDNHSDTDDVRRMSPPTAAQSTLTTL